MVPWLQSPKPARLVPFGRKMDDTIKKHLDPDYRSLSKDARANLQHGFADRNSMT
jgi:hypothetical protein